MIRRLFFLSCLLLTAAGPTDQGKGFKAKRSPSPKGVKVYFIKPANGEVVTNPVKVVFGLTDEMGIAPAKMAKPNTGHHHLVIDGKHLPPLDKPLEPSAKLIHYGNGQTETTLKLDPGSHTLQAILADHDHIPHDPAVVSEQITIVVK